MRSSKINVRVLSKAQFFAAFFLCVPLLFAQEGAEREIALSGPITSIEISGLKRTKPHIARYPLEQFLGQDAETLDLNEVHAAVKDTGILEPVTVELAETDNGLALRVTVQEKWSFFPVPLVISSSGETSFGLFLADTNAFGLRDQAAVGGVYSPSGLMGMALYNHTPNRQGSVGWNTIFMYTRQENEDVDSSERLHRRYTADMFRFSLGLYYPFTSLISGSASVSYTNIILKDSEDALNQPGGGAALLSFSPGFSLRSSSWDGYLLSQRTLSLGYAYNLALGGSSFHEVNFRAVYEQSLMPGFRFNLRSGAVWKSGSDPLFEDGPNKAQVDILPWKFSARHYAGFSAGLEKYLIKVSWGTLSVLGSWQCVFSQGPLSENKAEFNHGPSGGIRFYLSRVAIPALGTGMAYNISTGIYQFSFSVGMGF